MVFSDTTEQNGLVQNFEFWTRLKHGQTGNVLKDITARINAAFDHLMPFLLSYSDNIRWDDVNHTDRPFGTINLTSGQNDYTISQDDNTLDILNLTRVRILVSAGATDYVEIRKMNINDFRALEALLPNPSNSGTPTRFLEQGNSIFLDPNPDYSATNGIQLFFEREQSYFVSTDTTKEPGFPRPHHELLSLYAALDWLMVNRAKDRATIARLEGRILSKEQALFDIISMRNPTKSGFSVLPSGERPGSRVEAHRRATSGRLDGFFN